LDKDDFIREFGQVSLVYYESRKREVKIRLMNEGRCDERLKARVEESTFPFILFYLL
jgi:hypothetical protein